MTLTAKKESSDLKNAFPFLCHCFI